MHESSYEIRIKHTHTHTKKDNGFLNIHFKTAIVEYLCLSERVKERVSKGSLENSWRKKG